MTHLRYLLTLLIATVAGICFAAETVQPKIMVIPYVGEGEDLRTVLENDANKRIALTKIKEAFDSRGFTTVDFLARLKAQNTTDAFADEAASDVKSMIVESSGADIYVEAEIIPINSSTGNAVKIILTGYDSSTGNSLSNKVGESGKFYTDDFGKLASKAVESCASEFLNVMQDKFSDIVDNGRSILVNISVEEGSPVNLESETGDSMLSDALEMWMEENAYKNNYHIQGTTANRMIFDDVRIPLRDPATGNNFNINKFGMKLYRQLKSMGVSATRNIKGNTLYITIKG